MVLLLLNRSIELGERLAGGNLSLRDFKLTLLQLLLLTDSALAQYLLGLLGLVCEMLTLGSGNHLLCL